MGDFSSTFSIHNKLDVDLKVTKNGDPTHGYWLRWPNEGKVGLLSTSDQFQLKDYAGPNGTDGSVFITGKRPDTGREFKIQLRMACPFAGLNVVEVKSDAQPVLLVGAGELKPDGHPMIFDVIIDRRV